jgi:hypothetical protein
MIPDESNPKPVYRRLNPRSEEELKANDLIQQKKSKKRRSQSVATKDTSDVPKKKRGRKKKNASVED